MSVWFSVSLYLSPAETWCFNLDYYIPDSEGVTKTFDNASISRLRKFNTPLINHVLYG